MKKYLSKVLFLIVATLALFPFLFSRPVKADATGCLAVDVWIYDRLTNEIVNDKAFYSTVKANVYENGKFVWSVTPYEAFVNDTHVRLIIGEDSTLPWGQYTLKPLKPGCKYDVDLIIPENYELRNIYNYGGVPSSHYKITGRRLSFTFDSVIKAATDDPGMGLTFHAEYYNGAKPEPPHQHTLKSIVNKATTTKNGSVQVKCSDCGEVISTQTIYYPKTISLSAASYTYNGKTQKPTVSVKDSAGKIITSANYTLSYSGGCKNAGSYNVQITFKGNYTGKITEKFTIKKAGQTISAANQSKTLGDKAFSLNVKHTKGNGKLTYRSSNTKVASVYGAGIITIKGVGKATITVTAAATANYNKATKNVTITVNPKGTSLTGTIKNSASKKMTVQWKRNSAVTGYQIRYSSNSSFKGASIVTVKKNSTLKTTISKLTKGKTYYVQIRTYKTVSGKNYYSGWSTAKKVKITK